MSKLRLKKWIEARSLKEKNELNDPGIKLFGHVIAIPPSKNGHTQGAGRLNGSNHHLPMQAKKKSRKSSSSSCGASNITSIGGESVCKNVPSTTNSTALQTQASESETWQRGDERGSSSGSNSGCEDVADVKYGVRTTVAKTVAPSSELYGSTSAVTCAQASPEGGVCGSVHNVERREEGCREASDKVQVDSVEENRLKQSHAQQIVQDKEYERKDVDQQEDVLKKPEQPVACPRCESLDTKFCYFNNYNANQPRHFCKRCQRYWTAGGTLRNVPVGSGRRKNKHAPNRELEPTSHTPEASNQISGLAPYLSAEKMEPPYFGSSLDVPDLDMHLGRPELRSAGPSPSCKSNISVYHQSLPSVEAVYEAGRARAEPGGATSSLHTLEGRDAGSTAQCQWSTATDSKPNQLLDCGRGDNWRNPSAQGPPPWWRKSPPPYGYYGPPAWPYSYAGHWPNMSIAPNSVACQTDESWSSRNLHSRWPGLHWSPRENVPWSSPPQWTGAAPWSMGSWQGCEGSQGGPLPLAGAGGKRKREDVFTTGALLYDR